MILENPADSEKLTFYDYSIPFFVFSTAGAPVIIKGIHSSPVHILLRSGATSSFDGIFHIDDNADVLLLICFKKKYCLCAMGLSTTCFVFLILYY